MESLTPMLAVLDIVIQFISTFAANVTGTLLSADSSLIDFSIQLGRGGAGASVTQCTSQTCPGSFFTAIATAWANIGYLTHSDVLRFINETNFGKWAIILYIGGAITGLIGVATNSPMRNWTWFFIGPALYSFLIGTTMEVQGVNWVVANHAYPMDEVWRNAEAGLANTKLAVDNEIEITKNGPQGMYTVAMPMVFLDELFSATTNIIIDWTGIGREVGGRGDSNLSSPMGNPEGPWWLLSTLKWGMIENLTANTLRDPDIRDALVTFLGSECGDAFKQGINPSSYIAAAQARGASPVLTVMDKTNPGVPDYPGFKSKLSTTSIPTPRAVVRLLKAPADVPGSFAYFSAQFKNQEAIAKGRGTSIVCAEYLYTLIQAMRFEAGSAYYQMLRSAPNGLTREQLVRALIYGWDVRGPGDQEMTPPEQEAFLKHLTLVYILRNELLYAPQLTSVNQRFAPAEQSRSYSDAYVRTAGSKSKFIELYNAAVMMPYLQGILAYFLIMAYPIAAMLVVLPGHYKGFLTWVSFFAWVKLWDVGFAMVQVIERSVWAMVGNHSTMGGIARDLISTAEKVGGIGVTGLADAGGGIDPNFVGPPDPRVLETLNAIPAVCSLAANTMDGACQAGKPGADQDMLDAFQLFDTLLVNGAGIDLDLSNGWYIYIMSALYVAVPAVTGQLVLGAKAGSANMIKDAFQGVGNDGANAAKTGYQHQAVFAAQTNQGSLGQAAYGKAMRQSGAAGQLFDLKNAAMDAGFKKDMATGIAGAHNARAGMMAKTSADIDGVRNAIGNNLDTLQKASGFANTAAGKAGVGIYGGLHGSPAGLGKGLGIFDSSQSPGKGGKGAGDGGSDASWYPSLTGGATAQTPRTRAAWAKQWNAHAAMASIGSHQRDGIAEALAAGMNQDASWDGLRNSHTAAAANAYAGNVGQGAEFAAQTAAWEAKNSFGAHVSSMAGIAGMNAGNLSPGQKPTDMTGMAMNGLLGSGVEKKANYFGDTSNEGFLGKVANQTAWAKENLGSEYVQSGYTPPGVMDTSIRGWFEATTNPNVILGVPNVTGSAANLNASNVRGVIVDAASRATGADKYAPGLSTTLDQSKNLSAAESFVPPKK